MINSLDISGVDASMKNKPTGFVYRGNIGLYYSLMKWYALQYYDKNMIRIAKAVVTILQQRF